ncbi:hypothetical protein BGZ79_000998 [Entomortierella chlamydospora]|nr:hypothetical protein BGZ79_000998 [Entomortierella chlamydospora]
MRRVDLEAAPWIVNGKKRIKALGLVMYDPDAVRPISSDMGKQWSTRCADPSKDADEVNTDLKAVFSELMTQNSDVDTTRRSRENKELKPEAKTPAPTPLKPPQSCEADIGKVL